MSVADECKLRVANGVSGVDCDLTVCVFWRAIGHLGLGNGDDDACVLQHLQLLDAGPDVPAWLLSVKHRLEESRSGE